MADEALMALMSYGLGDAAINLVSDKEKKPVWRVQKDDSTYYLKRMPLTEERLRFVLAAVAHLRERGVNLPELLKTREGCPYACHAGNFYILTHAVKGDEPDYEQHLRQVVYSLAQFHHAGRGFQPPAEAVHSHLGTWRQNYARKRSEVTQFTEDAPDTPFRRVLRTYHHHMVRQIETAEALLAGDAYEEWVQRVEREGCICHQDYAAGNLRLHRWGVWVLDVDGLTLDLPARDLRKLINKVVRHDSNMNGRLKEILDAYQESYPLSHAELQVVAADLLFPHLFCGLVNKYYTGRTEGQGEQELCRRLEETVDVEQAKAKAVWDLLT